MQVSNRFHGYQLSIRFNSRQIVNRSSAKGKQKSEAYNCDEKLANKFIRKFMRKGEPFVMSINAKQRRVYSNLLLPSDFARVVDPKNCRSHCGSNLKPHFNVALPIIAATCPSSIVFLSSFFSPYRRRLPTALSSHAPTLRGQSSVTISETLQIR